ncbi:SCO family protein [Actinacidiphila guanduensis]|uniref:Protein SCO1/2 n=1 Tax=Actinacidiphila guanduensis TaxID=310781 RepID=A0A1G9ZIT1_9ACTN|nr:SCO family protein [Actinacidiphila guanduensis]SDN21224.1 protein SCO1/2 [Actinacidiphila guanduensis]
MGAVLAALGLALAGCGGGTTANGSGTGDAVPDGATGDSALNLALPHDLMTAPLVDSTGRTTSLAAFRGKVVVVSDVMTLCQETCPMDTANVVQAAEAVEKAGLGDKVEFLSITIDPARDSVAQLAAYRNLFAPAPADWKTLTGKPSDLAALWKGLGVWSQKVAEEDPPGKNWRTGATLTYDIDHSDDIFVLDGNGREQSLLQGVAGLAPGSHLPKDLDRFLNDDGRRNLAHPGGDAWTPSQVLQKVGSLLHRSIPQ